MEETKQKVAPKKVAPKKIETNKPVDTWVYKDKNYYLIGNKSPLTYTLPSRHSRRYPLVWFDPSQGYERELRYATNQQSIFVDAQDGQVTLKHIIFENGHLFVPKEKRNLQEFLAKHPHNNKIFSEFDPVVEAEDEFEDLEVEIEALNMAYEMDIDQAEAVLRVEAGSDVTKLSSKELRRDLLLMAKDNPDLFIDLANDDNVILRNFAIRSVEESIISLTPDNRSFTWTSNGRKLMNVPFDENPYSAMAAWFKTDEGLEVYRSIEKKLK
tara:strand:- start:1392 stop:2198 length:807 start_codon:yes stop_codon:yes gene_type:complete